MGYCYFQDNKAMSELMAEAAPENSCDVCVQPQPKHVCVYFLNETISTFDLTANNS